MRIPYVGLAQEVSSGVPQSQHLPIPGKDRMHFLQLVGIGDGVDSRMTSSSRIRFRVSMVSMVFAVFKS